MFVLVPVDSNVSPEEAIGKMFCEILESEGYEEVLSRVVPKGDEEEFLTFLDSLLANEEHPYCKRFFQEGAFENLMTYFGSDLVISVFGIELGPECDPVCDDNPQGCDQSVPVPSSLTVESGWSREAAYDVMGNNADTISAKLVNGCVIEVTCTNVHPISKAIVNHSINLGMQVNPEDLSFQIKDGVLRVNVKSNPSEVVLF